MEKTQELPKWFINGGAQIYSTGDSVENIFSGQKIDLNNLELSMYDYIKGTELVAYQTNDRGITEAQAGGTYLCCRGEGRRVEYRDAKL